MAQSVPVVEIIAQIRSESDTQTSNEATSIATDAEILVWLNKGYRRLFELMSAEAGEEYFAKSVLVTAPAFALPSDFLRELAVEAPTGGVLGGPRDYLPYNFQDRNDYTYDVFPRYRIQAGAIVWSPSTNAPTTSVRLWYLATPSALAADGAFDAVNGWDDYVVKYVVLQIRRKQEYDLSEAMSLLSDAESTVKHNAAKIRGYQETVSTHSDQSDGWYYNG